jgi:hypothetical protein
MDGQQETINPKPSRGVLMKKVLFATVALLSLGLIDPPAKADLILDALVFADLGSTGFGNAPRLLNIQNNGGEAGGVFYTGDPSVQGLSPQNTTTGFFTGLPPLVTMGSGSPIGTICTKNGGCGDQPQVQPDKSLVYSIGALGWFQGANVGIGLDTNQTQNSGPLTFNSLVLTLYDINGNVLANFQGNHPINISEGLLAAQQGNGNSVFNIELDPTQQAQFNSIIMAQGCTIGQFCSLVFEGLSASFGTGLAAQVCPAGGPAPGGFVAPPGGCFPSNDGQESFLAIQNVPSPIVGAGVPGLVTACLGMVALARRRRFMAWWHRVA